MAWSLTTLARLLAALTLVIGALVITPAADAIACAPELSSTHQVLEHDPGAGDHNSLGGEQGLCAHGHCHHTANERHLTRDFTLVAPPAHVQHDRPLNDRVASFASNGLMRPPRN